MPLVRPVLVGHLEECPGKLICTWANAADPLVAELRDVAGDDPPRFSKSLGQLSLGRFEPSRPAICLQADVGEQLEGAVGEKRQGLPERDRKSVVEGKRGDLRVGG